MKIVRNLRGEHSNGERRIKGHWLGAIFLLIANAIAVTFMV
jgi:hypothetical protein